MDGKVNTGRIFCFFEKVGWAFWQGLYSWYQATALGTGEWMKWYLEAGTYWVIIPFHFGFRFWFTSSLATYADRGWDNWNYWNLARIQKRYIFDGWEWIFCSIYKFLLIIDIEITLDQLHLLQVKTIHIIQTRINHIIHRQVCSSTPPRKTPS